MAFTRSRVRAPYPPPHDLADDDEREPNNSRSFCVQSHAESDTYSEAQLGTEAGGSDKSATPSERVQDADLRSEKALCRHEDLGDVLPSLADVIAAVEACPEISQDIRPGILALLRAATGKPR